MLTNTFCHIPGVGEITERSLWTAGILSWEAALQQASRPLRASWIQHIQESIRNYETRNAAYFAEGLPGNQHWRLYHDFQETCAFVDIETTGLHPSAEITTAVLYDGRSVRYYVNGDNLHQLPKALQDYALLVTYNGKTFDVPFIERFFQIRLPQGHIDVMYPLRSLRITGGLKACERQLGIGRPGLEDIGGFTAVLLWHDYRRGKNVKALETLLAYNIQDALSLHALMVHTHNEKVKPTPFAGSHYLPPPSLPELPFKPDEDTLRRILRPFLQAGTALAAFSQMQPRGAIL
jgi:uncharacterized protein YprB with RNaseH-like and TPR domain